MRFSNLNHPNIWRYNILSGNPDYLAMARANNPAFPASPFTNNFLGHAFTRQTHETGFPGGELGKWQTKSDTPEDGIQRDLQYYTVTMKWDIGENLSFESISSAWELHRRQTVDFDGSEFIMTTDEGRRIDNNATQEFHLSGSNFNDRVTWLAGLYTLEGEDEGSRRPLVGVGSAARTRRHQWRVAQSASHRSLPVPLQLVTTVYAGRLHCPAARRARRRARTWSAR